jgi:hypothetical protein
MTALASVLHSFYNGVENIFQYIAKEFPNFSFRKKSLIKRNKRKQNLFLSVGIENS